MSVDVLHCLLQTVHHLQRALQPPILPVQGGWQGLDGQGRGQVGAGVDSYLQVGGRRW